jgi:CO/xanthine dehydrogenase FAD-binding subunit
MALDARVEAVNLAGSRAFGLEELFLAPRRSTIAENKELLVGFYIPLRNSSQSSAFMRVMRPQGVALPVLNIAVWLQRREDWIEDIHLALGPSGPTPFRARMAESAIRGESITSNLIDKAHKALLEEVRLRTSRYRASAEYRQHLAKVLLQDVIEIAWQRTYIDK